MSFDYATAWRLDSERRRKDPIYRERQRGWNKAWRETHPPTVERKAIRAAQERARRENPAHAQRIRARLNTRNALRRGDLVRLRCETCGAAKSEAHHEDYSQPLAVRWLCRTHHRELHAKAEGA